MNTNRILYHAMQSVIPAETGAGGGAPNPQAMSVDTLAHMANKNAPVPAVPASGAHQAGINAGNAILAAEQSIAVAVQSEESTRVSTLKALIAMPDPIERNQFVGGLSNAFIAAAGPAGKVKKTHQNFVTDCNRIKGYLTLAEPGPSVNGFESDAFKAAKKQALEWLDSKEPGPTPGTVSNTLKKYGARIALFPPLTNKKATTPTVGTSTGTQSNAAAQLASAPVVQQPNTPQTQVGNTTATFNTNQLVAEINTMHENDIEPACIAFANRLKKSNSPAYQMIGADLLDKLESIKGKPETAQPEKMPMAANA